MLCRGVESMIHKEIFMGRFRNHQLIYKARSLFSQLIKQYCLPHYRLLKHWREQKTCAFGIAMASTSSVMSQMTKIETLTGSNFKKWKEDVEIALGLMDIDLPLRVPEPPKITDTSTRLEKDKAEKWESNNRMCIKIMQRAMTDTVRGGIPVCERAADFLAAIEEKFKESDKAEITNLMNTLSTMKYDGNGSVREHCLKMIDIASKLKTLEVPVADPWLVYLALSSLPPQFSQLVTTYNTQRDKWTINELISICVQEEDRIKKEKGKVVATVNLVTKGQSKNYRVKKPTFKNFSKGSSSAGGSHFSKDNKTSNSNVFKCFFCDKVRHLKRNCHKYRNWLTKKGIHKKENTK
ncbi:uncharacterized protein LOC133722499 [Rosa rugosa]|uniref:uncharacterized protein LOC133722499 n=1 Tax=Rosa rugosa TaxID=74645 RepID=UPI002B401A47|nr:uncharacterized protein LOC133722499 [Rosa rugosa]